jgi:hypothetical protein
MSNVIPFRHPARRGATLSFPTFRCVVDKHHRRRREALWDSLTWWQKAWRHVWELDGLTVEEHSRLWDEAWGDAEAEVGLPW